MGRRKIIECEAIFLVLALVLACSASAQSAPTDIGDELVPGRLDIMQGTAVKLGGAAPVAGPQPESYHWEIVQGEGGVLFNDDRGDVIFQAPMIKAEFEVFVIRLTVDYPGGERASNSVHLRVHRDEPRSRVSEAEQSIEDVMTGYYRREAETKEQKRRPMESRTVVVSQGYRGFHGGFGYRGPGWGWGYGWGWPAAYPVFAPVIMPPPGVDWRPGVGDWREPVAIPYEDLISTFPEDIANDYAPQDYPGNGLATGEEGSEDLDTGFIVMPPGAEKELDGLEIEVGSSTSGNG